MSQLARKRMLPGINQCAGGLAFSRNSHVSVCCQGRAILYRHEAGGRNSHVSVCCQVNNSLRRGLILVSQLARKRMLPARQCSRGPGRSPSSQLARKRMLPGLPRYHPANFPGRNSHVSVCCQHSPKIPAIAPASRNSHVSVCCRVNIISTVPGEYVASENGYVEFQVMRAASVQKKS